MPQRTQELKTAPNASSVKSQPPEHVVVTPAASGPDEDSGTTVGFSGGSRPVWKDEADLSVASMVCVHFFFASRLVPAQASSTEVT